jgi:hypothetical protein
VIKRLGSGVERGAVKHPVQLDGRGCAMCIYIGQV